MMRGRWWLLIVMTLFLGGCLQAAPRPDALSFPPLEFKVPQVERFETANGSRVYLQEDFELPLVELTAVISGGTLNDPANKVGLVSVFASTLRAGGAGSYTPRELDEQLELMAANLAVGADQGAVTISLSLRQEDLDRGMAILANLLRRPRFDEQRFELVRSQAREGIRRRDDEPSSVAHRKLTAAVYGDHPLGRESTLETIDNLSRADLLSHYRRFFHPNNLRIAVSGAVTRERLSALLKQHLGDWLKQDFRSQQNPPLQPPESTRLFVNDKQIPQTTVLMGHLGLKRSDPDFFAVRVMNYILGGGGFNSRLMREVRSNRGLAYSVYSYYMGGQILPGMFIAGCETRNDAVIETVQLIRSLMEQMREQPVSREELSLAKESIINSFVFAFADSHDVVERTLRLEMFDYPEGYLETFRDKIASVTIEDVQRAAQTYLRPDDMQIVLVGDQGAFAAPPELLGLPIQRN